MNKKAVIGAAVVMAAALSGGGYYWWLQVRETPASARATQAVANMQQVVSDVNGRLAEDLYAGSDVTTPSIPDVNPYRNTNPFSDLKVNPFE